MPNHRRDWGFNPLFVGEVSSSTASTSNNITMRWFQSPLRRGSVFIVKKLVAAGWDPKVSIPSSSGKCLHQVDSSLSARTAQFQSPLRRGSVFITPLAVTDLRASPCFNPLFVGEVSSSWISSIGLSEVFEFQSPLRRGSVFIAEAGVIAFEKSIVSIPSSSGKCLHPAFKHLHSYGRCGCFNPLFVGEVSSS